MSEEKYLHTYADFSSNNEVQNEEDTECKKKYLQ